MRDPDESIPLTEEMYRGATAAQVVNGALHFTAIDSRGVSCNRQRYAGPESVLTTDRTHIFVTTPGEIDLLPRRVKLCNGFEYEIFAHDDPKEGDAHCEVRWRRADAPTSMDHVEIKSGVAKQEMKVHVARAFRPYGQTPR